MENEGIGFLVFENGFACSDNVVFDVEHDFDTEKKLTKTTILRFYSIFECVGKVVKDTQVYCLFKAGDKKHGFTGQIRGKSGDLTIIDIFSKTDRINEIIAKIKSLKP